MIITVTGHSVNTRNEDVDGRANAVRIAALVVAVVFVVAFDEGDDDDKNCPLGEFGSDGIVSALLLSLLCCRCDDCRLLGDDVGGVL